jgi:hypothetical protein
VTLDQIRDALTRRPELEDKVPEGLLHEFDALMMDKFSGDSPDKRLRRRVTQRAFTLFFVIVTLSFGMWVLGAFRLFHFADGTNTVLESIFLGGFVLLIGGLLRSLWKPNEAADVPKKTAEV